MREEGGGGGGGRKGGRWWHSLAGKVCDLLREAAVEVHGAGHALTLLNHAVGKAHPAAERGVGGGKPGVSGGTEMAEG